MTIALFVILGFVFLGLVILVATKKIRIKRAKEVLNKFEGKKVLGISSNANFFGVESLGAAQLRGNGVLLLTSEEFFFEMWMPKKEFHISISSIINIEVVKSHLGKTKSRPLLKVVFQNVKGETDSAAWLVGNIPHWKDVSERLIKREKKE